MAVPLEVELVVRTDGIVGKALDAFQLALDARKYYLAVDYEANGPENPSVAC